MADVAALSFWLSVLFGAQLWWLWEMVAIFMYFSYRFFRSWGKDIHLLLRYSEGGWHQVGRYLVPQTSQWFRSKSKRSFTAEPNKGTFDITDLSGNHALVLHDYDYARPRYGGLENGDGTLTNPEEYPNEDPKGKDILKGKIPRTAKPKVGDPSSVQFDAFVAGEAWAQGLKANAHQKTDLAPLIMVLAIGALAGFMIAYIGFPQHVPVPVPVITTT